MSQPPIQFLLLQILNIKSFSIEGWSDRIIDDEKCAKNAKFFLHQRLEKCFCLLFMQLHVIIDNECLVYINSLDYTLIIYVTIYVIILISNRANFEVRGPSSLYIPHFVSFSISHKVFGITFQSFFNNPKTNSTIKIVVLIESHGINTKLNFKLTFFKSIKK